MNPVSGIWRRVKYMYRGGCGICFILLDSSFKVEGERNLLTRLFRCGSSSGDWIVPINELKRHIAILSRVNSPVRMAGSPRYPIDYSRSYFALESLRLWEFAGPDGQISPIPDRLLALVCCSSLFRCGSSPDDRIVPINELKRQIAILSRVNSRVRMTGYLRSPVDFSRSYFALESLPLWEFAG
ncbi:hypothetical protein J6590_073881 [Homalodisca vitripennis]|nr:hypothetical protein J6590_073881 [Homalodisca vitripennis]